MVLYIKNKDGVIFELLKIYPNQYKVHPLRDNKNHSIEENNTLLLNSKDVVKINSNLQELKH